MHHNKFRLAVLLTITLLLVLLGKNDYNIVNAATVPSTIVDIVVFYHFNVAETGTGSIEIIQTAEGVDSYEIERCVLLADPNGNIIPIQDRSFNHHRWFEFQLNESDVFHFVFNASECPQFTDFNINYAGDAFLYSPWRVNLEKRTIERYHQDMEVVINGYKQTVTVSLYPAIQGLNWSPTSGGTFVSIAAGLEQIVLNANSTRSSIHVPALETLEAMGVQFIDEDGSQWTYSGNGLLVKK